MNKDEQLFSPQELSFIENNIRNYDQYQNAMVLGQVIMELTKVLNRHPFQTVEAILRNASSDTYLISRSLEEMPDFESILPLEEGSYERFLWICVNGLQEAQELLANLELTKEENLRLLRKTGMLVPKEGSEFSRASKRKFN